MKLFCNPLNNRLSLRVRVRVRVRVKLLRLFRVNNYGWRAAMEQLANLI